MAQFLYCYFRRIRASYVLLKLFVSGAALVALSYLNLNRCELSDEGCDKLLGE